MGSSATWRTESPAALIRAKSMGYLAVTAAAVVSSWSMLLSNLVPAQRLIVDANMCDLALEWVRLTHICVGVHPQCERRAVGGVGGGAVRTIRHVQRPVDVELKRRTLFHEGDAGGSLRRPPASSILQRPRRASGRNGVRGLSPFYRRNGAHRESRPSSRPHTSRMEV